jgi:hypothetical protein
MVALIEASFPTATGVSVYQGKSLLFPIQPAPGETLLGFVARAVDRNYLGSVQSFLAMGGLNVSIKGDYLTKLSNNLPILSELLCVPVSNLQQLWGAKPLTEDGKRKLGGVYLRQHQICQHARRLPQTREAQPHDQATWMVSHLDFCPISWTRLTNDCPICQQALTWPQARAINTCGRCGGLLSFSNARRVPIKDREVLSWVLDLFNDDEQIVTQAINQVPTFYEIQSATDVYELVLAFAQAAYGERFEFFRTKGRWGPEYVAAGARMVLEYPRPVWDLFRNSDAKKLPAYLTTAMRVARDHSQPVVSRNIERLMATHRRQGVGRPSTTENFNHRKISLTLAGGLLSITPLTVQGLIDEGHLNAVEPSTNYRFAKVCRLEVYALREKLKSWFDKNEFKKKFSLSDIAIEQLLASSWLIPEFDPVITYLKGDRALTPHSSNRLTDELSWLRKVHDEPGYIPLRAAFRGVGGREKPWSPVIAAGLDWKFPGGIGLLQKDNKQCLAVHEAAARAFIMGGPDFQAPYNFSANQYGGYYRDWLTPGETEEYLNCTAQDVIWLRNRGHIAMLEHEKPRYCRASVRNAGIAFMSTREAASRLGASPQDMWSIIEACPPSTSIGQGFHHRETLETIIKAEASKPCWWN